METDPRHLLVKVARILDRLDIPYAVTGGMAIYVWGRPRFTADIDIVVLLKVLRVGELTRALSRLGEAGYISEDDIRRALETHGEFNFIDGGSGIKVDFWISGDAAYDKSRFKNRVAKTILGYHVFFVSPEDLILSKLRWHVLGESSRQLEDVESILNAQKKLNRDYLYKWAKIHKTIQILHTLWKQSKK